MNIEKEKFLFEKYPQLFRDKDSPMTHTAMCWGIEVGDGWYGIIDELCERIQTHCDNNGYDEVRFSQIKEKYGTLRVYVNFGSDEIYDYIDEAQERSSHVCEVCGSKRGKIRTDLGWLSVRCKKCWTKYNKDAEARLALIMERK